jgi:hypothetical protein
MAEPVTVLCMKWRSRYPSVYANRLYAAVRRHLSRPFRFVCLTDDPIGLDPGIDWRPLPPIPLPEAVAWTPWRKLSVWRYPLADLEGDVLFLDLDLVVTGPLDPMFDHAPGRYCVIENWTQKGRGIGNTSVFRFRAGAHPEVYDRFAADPDAVLSQYRIEQQYISTLIPDPVFWPSDWCVSFKHDIVPKFPHNWVRPPSLPAGAKVVVFTGRPDIDEALRGYWPAPWYKKFYKHAKPAAWLNAHWRDEEAQP